MQPLQANSDPRRLPWDLATGEGREEFVIICSALRALVRGECPEHLQKVALDAIIKLCGTYDLSFRPGGEDGRRDSDFAEGMRFVGLRIITMLKVETSEILKTDNRDQPREQP